MIRRVAALVVAGMLCSSCAVLGFASACEGTEIIANFEQVGDLVENANVQSSDVEIGTVTNIELDGWEARVTMCLSPNEQIPADIEAVVRTTSLLGEKFVDLQPGSAGPPFLEDGAVIESANTSKATELEEVFARLASVIGAGNLEQINQFTSAQANILRDHSDELREVLHKLSEFTGVLVSRQDQIAQSIDSLDSVASTVLDDAAILERFLESFASSSGVLSEQRNDLQDLLFALDEFTAVSVRLLEQTETGLNEQFSKLRPVLRSLASKSDDLALSLRTLATFTEWWPETMPGDYVQLDVCQAPPDIYTQGVDCPQSDGGTFSTRGTRDAAPRDEPATTPLDFILRRPVRGAS